MRIRHPAITTALAGLALGVTLHGGTGLAQADMNRPETPAAENRRGEDSSVPVIMPSPIDVEDRAAPVTMDGAAGRTTSVEARDLIGTELKSAENETVGEVESIYVSQEGEVRSVIVGVGGLLGLGERKVALGWNALNVADDGQTVHTTLTKDQLSTLPEYQYADSSVRGKLFNDNGVVTN